MINIINVTMRIRQKIQSTKLKEFTTATILTKVITSEVNFVTNFVE